MGLNLKPTNWIVITGGPCAGKTSLLSYLNYKGFPIVPETARLWIELEMSRGLTLEKIRENEYEFQVKVLEMKKEKESRTPQNERIFWDRAMHDSIAYGVEEARVAPYCHFRYKKVFHLEPVGFISDHVRTENEKKCLELGERIYTAYLNDGYDVIRVPKMPIVERADWILKATENIRNP